MRLVGELDARFVASGFGLSPAATVSRFAIFGDLVFPQTCVKGLAEVLIELHVDSEVSHPLLLLFVLAADGFVVPAMDLNEWTWWSHAEAVHDISIEDFRIGQVLFHADGSLVCSAWVVCRKSLGIEDFLIARNDIVWLDWHLARGCCGVCRRHC